MKEGIFKIVNQISEIIKLDILDLFKKEIDIPILGGLEKNYI
jgi:hypothetical protein